MTEQKMKLEDWLDDLCVRFIINLPQEDLSTVARICFQVEEAQWFYEDFIRPLDPTLPSMTLRSFCLRIFQHCPLLASFSVENHMRAFEEFLQYKTRIPVRGAILLNEAMDAAVLVKGWKKGAGWSFPRGKINKDEDDLDCAVREVYEETGYDIHAAGLVPDRKDAKFIEIVMREQQVRLYMFRDVPMDTYFEPKTRKEISKIQWWNLSQLPAFRKKGANAESEVAAASNANKFYMVAPFLGHIKKWVSQQKKKDSQRMSSQTHLTPQAPLEDVLTEEDIGTQTEAGMMPPRATPALDTLEGATRELQRLLKVQPSSQGLQVMAPPPPPTAALAQVPNRGSALLALLRSKPASSQLPPSVASQHIPHTPIDHIRQIAPQPQTPHHHHLAQRPPASIYQSPPPAFALQPHMERNIPGHMYRQNGMEGATLDPVAPRHMTVHHPQVQQIQPSHSHIRPQTLDRHAVPPAGVAHGLAHRPSQGSPMAAGQPRQDQQNVEKNVSTQQLNTHKQALLSAFKSNPVQQAANDPKHNGTQMGPPVQPSSAMPPFMTHAHPPQPLLTQVNQQPAQSRAVTSGYDATANRQIGTPKAPLPNDKHRNDLLGLFKQQVSNRAGPTAAAPVLNQRGTVSGHEDPASSQARPQPSTAQIPGVAAHAHGGPTRMDPESTLPFGALSILSRPKAGVAAASAAPSVPRTVSSQPSFAQGGLPNREAEAAVPSAAPSSQTATLDASRTGESQHRGSVPTAPPQATSPPKPASDPHQKQKLLSLFGSKQTPAPAAASTGDNKANLSTAGIAGQQGGANAYRSSRIASLASLVDENATGPMEPPAARSQTPISSADRNFLLGYLQSMSNSAAR